MRTRWSLALLLAVAVSACGGAPPPACREAWRTAARVSPVAVPPREPGPPEISVTLAIGREAGEGGAIFVEPIDAPERRVTIPDGSDAATMASHVGPLVEGADRVVLAADERLPYQIVVQILDAVRAAGVTRFSIAVQPADPQ